MYIPFPERISIFHASAFGVLLAVILVMGGTGAIFSALAFVFIVTATIAFNVAGGLTRPSGSYVFFFALLGVIVGLMVKAVIWEPADSLLHSPVTTMGAYTGAAVAMLASVYLSRRFSRKEGYLQNICTTDQMGQAAMGCVVGGVALPIVLAFATSTGSALFLPLASAANQLNRFLSMAIILGVTYEIRKSAGKRSFNASVYLATGVIWFDGVFLGYSKEALYTPPLCWLISCAALRYRFAAYQLIGLILFFLLSSHYIVPYCQYARGGADPLASKSEQIARSFELITHLNEIGEKYRAESASVVRTEDGFFFFEKDEGLFDRLQMIGIDDALITVTDRKGAFGMAPYILYISSFVPRVLWKSKPSISMGNTFAHEIGFNEEDTTTGISFTPVSEAYHEAKWFGVLVVEPIVWTALFVIMDSMCGDLRRSPWGILVLALFAHIAPEGALQGAFYMMSYGAFIVLFVAYFSAYLMPLLASLVAPPKRPSIPPGGALSARGQAFPPAQPASLKQ